jgi:hypothetical protein
MIAGDYGQAIVDHMMKTFTWFGFATPGKNGDLIMSVGTAFPVRTPQRLILVTAGHVYDAYQREKAAATEIACQIGNAKFQPEERLIDRGRCADLVTFELSDQELEAIGCLPIEAWPPLKPEPGWAISYAGVPKIARKQLAARIFEFGVSHHMGLVHSVNEQTFSSIVEHERLVVDPNRPSLPPGSDMGGMSGGPVITMRGEKFLTYRLCGLITDSMPSADYFLFTRADLIGPDGTIND